MKDYEKIIDLHHREIWEEWEQIDAEIQAETHATWCEKEEEEEIEEEDNDHIQHGKKRLHDSFRSEDTLHRCRWPR